MDQPELILKEAIENHQNMIKQFKGTCLLVSFSFSETGSYSPQAGLELARLALNLRRGGA